MELTQSVARFVAETTIDDIPREAIGIAKRLILDCLGVALAGSREPAAAVAVQFVQELGGNPQASVIGQGFRTSTVQAALANGVAAHVLAYDDASGVWIGHPSAVVLPAVLAVAERRSASGKDVLESYVVGEEVTAKLGLAAGPRHYEQGWHTTATMGTVGATAAAAKALGLDVEKTKHALGIGATQSAGLRQNFGTMAKSLHAGLASRNGVFAAGLAEKGLIADQGILEGHHGFLNTLCSGKFEPGPLESGLGRPFDLVAPGISIKRYPSCLATSSSIDATLRLVQENEIDPEEVVAVSCAIPSLSKQVLTHPVPRCGLEGKLSLEYCLAVALVERSVGLRHFADEMVQDSRLRRLMQKVVVRYVDEPGDFSEVMLELEGGRSLHNRVSQPKGSPGNPLTDNEVISKFVDCAGVVLDREKIEKIIDAVMDLERTSNIASLMEVLSTRPL